MTTDAVCGAAPRLRGERALHCGPPAAIQDWRDSWMDGMVASDKKDEAAATVLNNLLGRDDLTSDQLIELVRMTRPPVEVETERVRGEFQRRQPWYVVAPWAALFTLIGTLGAAWTTGYFENDRAQDEQIHAVNLEDRRFRSTTFERLLVIDRAALGLGEDATAEELFNAADVERRARICFAHTFGLIEIPEFVVGYPRLSKDYRDAVDAIMNTRFKCEDAEVPSTLLGPASPRSRVDCAAPGRRATTVALPAAELPATPADIMVQRAIGELGVHEDCDLDRIRAYFASTDQLNATEDISSIPWSAVFVSWLIREAGNPAGLGLGRSHMGHWNSALARGVAIPGPAVAARPGDIVVWSTPQPARDHDIVKIRAGDSGIWTGFAGIVITVEDTIVNVIGGNINNTVAVARRSLSDPNIVGIIRF